MSESRFWDSRGNVLGTSQQLLQPFGNSGEVLASENTCPYRISHRFLEKSIRNNCRNYVFRDLFAKALEIIIGIVFVIILFAKAVEIIVGIVLLGLQKNCSRDEPA